MKQKRGLTVWTTAVPLYFELIAVSSISIMDVFFMSLISDKAVAALGAATQVLLIFMLLIRTLAGGAGAVAAQSIGARDRVKTVLSFMYTLLISIVFGVVFSLFLFLSRNHVGVWMGLTGETLDITQRYLAIIGPAFFLLAVRSGYSAIVAVKGKSKANLLCSLVSNVVNVFFNCLFVLGWFGLPQLGVEGVALATAISHLVYLVLIAWIAHRHLSVKFVFPKDIFQRLKKLTRPVLSIAIPNCGDLLSHSIFQVAIVMVVIRIGDDAVACHTYLRQIMTFVIIWSFAVGQGQAIWTAHLVGAGQHDKASTEIKKSILRCLALSLPLTLSIYVFSGPLVRLFTDSPQIVAMAGSAMLAYIGIEIGRAFNATLSFSLASAGDAKYPAALAFIFNWVVGLSLAYGFGIALQWGLLGVLIGVAMDELVRAPFLYRRLTSRRWIKAVEG